MCCSLQRRYRQSYCRRKRVKVGDDGMVLEMPDLAVDEEKALL